jgi:hypothetical protein
MRLRGEHNVRITLSAECMALVSSMPQNERDRRLIKLWLQQPTDRRTMDDVLAFYGGLQQHNPELLPPSSRGDPYQQMESILSAHITPENASP